MTDSGLKESEVNTINAVFQCHSEISKAILFGSRAKGTARPNSDIDIAVCGIDDLLGIEKLAMELDELPLPYKFDIQSMSSIRNPALLEHIKRVGKILYQKDEKTRHN